MHDKQLFSPMLLLLVAQAVLPGRLVRLVWLTVVIDDDSDDGSNNSVLNSVPF